MKFNMLKGTDKKSDGTNSMEYILLHHTGGGSFKGNMNYLSENKAQVSVHYVVGPKGEIGKIGEDTDIMWHGGVGDKQYGDVMNNKAIGIEVVSDGKKFTIKQIMSLMNLVIYLKERYNIPNSKIIRHKDFTSRKTDIGDNFYKIVNFKSFEDWKKGLITEFKGVKVIIGGLKTAEKRFNAYYNPKNKIIHLLPNYYRIKDYMVKYSVKLHEFSHYIFLNKIPKVYRILWKLIWGFDNKIVKRINKILGTNFQKNEFVTNYASTNYLEGFSENIEEEYKRIKLGKPAYKGYLGIKIKICNKLFNMYKGDV